MEIRVKKLIIINFLEFIEVALNHLFYEAKACERVGEMFVALFVREPYCLRDALFLLWTECLF